MTARAKSRCERWRRPTADRRRGPRCFDPGRTGSHGPSVRQVRQQKAPDRHKQHRRIARDDQVRDVVDVAAAEHLQPCDDVRCVHGQQLGTQGLGKHRDPKPARRDRAQTNAATTAAEDPAEPAWRVEPGAGQRGPPNIEISHDTALQMVVSARHRRCGPTATIAQRKPGPGGHHEINDKNLAKNLRGFCYYQ